MPNTPRQDVDSTWRSSARGERAWKEVTSDVSSRNAEARKAGRLEREQHERGRAEVRRSADAKRHAKLVDGKP